MMNGKKLVALSLFSSVFLSGMPVVGKVPTNTDYIKGEERYYKRPGTPEVIGKTGTGKKVKLAGRTTLFSALSVATQTWGLKFKVGKDVENVDILSVLETDNPAEFIDMICSSADVWCDYIPSRNLVMIEKTKSFVVDVNPEGVVMTSYGGSGSLGGMGAEGGGGGEGGEGGGATNVSAPQGESGEGSSARTLTYFAKNVSYPEFVSLMSEMFGIKIYPSPQGFLQMELSPSQYRTVRRYFEETEKRKELINVEVKLVRVDLKDEFKWGVNWNALFSGFRVGSVTRALFGVNSSPLEPGDPRGTLGLIPKGETEPTAILEALQTFGDVHMVDSWHYQMVTGTPIPFSNYRLERYFTFGASQTDASTEITTEVHEDEAGFKGSLAVYKRGDGKYFVGGFVDISVIAGYTEVAPPSGGGRGGDGGGGASSFIKAPNLEGKVFRIATQLSDLNRMIVVGGFRSLGLTSEDKGVPWLQRIPILGYLFKGKKNLKQNSEFVVLITLKPAEEKDATELVPEEEDVLKKLN